MKKQAKPAKGKVVSFRLWPPYSMRIEEQASAARLRESEYARLATMLVSDAGLLDLNARMQRMEEQLIRLRNDLSKDFNHAPSDDGGEC